MKWISLIVLAVLLMTALSPLTAFAVPVAGAGAPVLGTLDVCHSATPALSSGGTMPWVNESPGDQVPLLVISSHEQSPLLFSHLILPSQYDRPPKA
jgi:hypothetical protein